MSKTITNIFNKLIKQIKNAVYLFVNKGYFIAPINEVHIFMKRILLNILIMVCTLTMYGQNIEKDGVQIEGYYSQGWENSSFYEIINGNVYKPIWLSFDKSINDTDSLKYLIDSFKNKEISIYIKVRGIKRTGGNYGHLGGAAAELIVTKILSVDPTKTLTDFLDKKNNK